MTFCCENPRPVQQIISKDVALAVERVQKLVAAGDVAVDDGIAWWLLEVEPQRPRVNGHRWVYKYVSEEWWSWQELPKGTAFVLETGKEIEFQSVSYVIGGDREPWGQKRPAKGAHHVI